MQETHVSPDFQKVLKFTAVRMLFFILCAVVIGLREFDVFIGLILFTALFTPIAAVISSSMLSFVITDEGIMGSFQLMKWENISRVKKDFFLPNVYSADKRCVPGAKDFYSSAEAS